jgi:hypothetical protein
MTIFRTIVFFLSVVGILLAQQATLRIVSPANLAVVHTGEKVVVTVEASGAKFKMLVLIPPGAIPWPDGRAEPPFAFPLSIPRDMLPGLYPIEVDGGTDTGGRITSNRIWIDVEPRGEPISVRPQSNDIELCGRMRGTVDVYGTYADGSTVTLTKSTRTSYVPEDPKILRVVPYGTVEGVSPGSTYLDIRVGDKVLKIPVVVRDKC